MDGTIYKAISAVLADVGAVGKDGYNGFNKYKYRSIDAVMNAMHPAMAKHGIFVIPEVLDVTREERQSQKDGVVIYSVAKVKYTFYAEDGSSVSAVVVGEGMDKGDKSTNKAMSAAFKYACFQAFCIPTEEMVDSEKDSIEVSDRMATPDELAKLEAEAAIPFPDGRTINLKNWNKLPQYPNITKAQCEAATAWLKQKREAAEKAVNE